MLFSCAPPDAILPDRFPGTARGRGKYRTIDIHCHVHCSAAVELAKDAFRPEYEPSLEFADHATRAVNRAQGERIAPPAHFGRAAFGGHGRHGNRHPGAVAFPSPNLLLGGTRIGDGDGTSDQ